MDRDGHGHDLMRVVPQVRLDQPQESLACRTGSAEDEQRQCHLKRNHHTMCALAVRASHHTSRAGLHDPAHVRPRELQRR